MALAGVLTVLSAAIWSVNADDVPPAVVENADVPGDDLEYDSGEELSLLEQVSDPAFDTLVNLALVGPAIRDLDSVTLADVSLQLLAAEQLLRREHNGISAQQMFRAAASIAAEQQDDDSLARLEAAATAAGHADWAALVSAARTLGASQRSVNAAINEPAEGASEDAQVQFQSLANEVRVARALRHRPSLEMLVDVITDNEVISATEKTSLLELTRGALESIPAEVDPTSDLLASLTLEASSLDIVEEWSSSEGAEGEFLDDLISSSRGAKDDEDEEALEPQQVTGSFLTSNQSKYPYNYKVLRFCESNYSKKVGDGQCAALNAAAISTAGASRFPPTGLNADYVWGTKVATLKPKSYSGAASILPGDMIQFRNAKFYRKYSLPKGGWKSYSKSCAHHSAVIRATGQKGLYLWVYQQNSGGKKFVTRGWFDFRYMTAGTAWVYRPTKTGTSNTPTTSSQKITYRLVNKTPYNLTLTFSPSGNTSTLAKGKTVSCTSSIVNGKYPKVKARTPGGVWWERTISKPGQLYEVIKKGTSGVQIVP